MKQTVMGAFALAAAFALAGAAQAQQAQSKPGGNVQRPAQVQQNNSMSQPNSMSRQAGDKQASKESQSFIKAAMQGNNAEVEVGKLAQEKGKSQAVKDAGRMLAQDHGAANAKAKAAAQQIGVEPTDGTSVGQKATYAKLKVLQGDMFDSSFVNSMVSDHDKDIREYQKASTRSDAAGQYAKETLPTLQKHKQHFDQLKAELKANQTMGSGGSSNKPKR